MMNRLLIIFISLSLLACGQSKEGNVVESESDPTYVEEKKIDARRADDVPEYLNSVAGHDERDFIVGKFDGVHEDMLFVYVKECRHWAEDSVFGGHFEFDDCDQPYKYYAISNSEHIPPIELFGHPKVQPKLVCEGDLDGNGTCEWGYLHTWMTSQWRTYRVYTLVEGQWRFLTDDWDLLSTNLDFRGSGKRVLEPGPRKGMVKVNYFNEFSNFVLKDTIITPNFAVVKE